MNKAINSVNGISCQLILVGIELSNNILALIDCQPKVLDIPHFNKIVDLSKEWNNVFLNYLITSKEGK